MMMLATLDAILVASTIAVTVAKSKRYRLLSLAISILSYLGVTWLATRYQVESDFMAFYLAAVFVTSAMRIFAGNWMLVTGLSLVFVTTDVRCFYLHQSPLLTGAVMAATFAVIQVAGAKAHIERLASRIKAN